MVQKRGDVAAERDRKEVPPLLAGSLGGLIGGVASFPLDTLKVRVQAGSTKTCTKSIFSGVLTPAIMCAPSWASIYFGYQNGRSLVGSDSRWSGAVGGFMAGVTCSVVYCPMQSVKATAQVNRVSSLQALRIVWGAGGLRRGFYRGYGATLAYSLPGYTAFFGVYEEAHRRLPGHGTLFHHVAAVSAASFAESVFGMPGETLLVRYQTDRSLTSLRATMSSLWQTHGFRCFHRGFALRWAFGTVLDGSVLGSIELLHRWWEGNGASVRNLVSVIESSNLVMLSPLTTS